MNELSTDQEQEPVKPADAISEPLQVVVFCGLQAAGKSTFYRQHFADTHTLISKDLMPNNRQPARHQQKLLEEALQAGSLVVVDNTNVSRAERAAILDPAHRYGAECICYYFPPQVKQSLERNKQRSGKARVPDIAIFAAHKRLEQPDYSEGFDKLYEVQVADEGKFLIRICTRDKARDKA